MTPLLKLALRRVEAMPAEEQDRLARHLLDHADASGDGDSPTPRPNQGARMAEALRRLAEVGAFGHIDDPVAWQRAIRKDRPLPGREGP